MSNTGFKGVIRQKRKSGFKEKTYITLHSGEYKECRPDNSKNLLELAHLYDKYLVEKMKKKLNFPHLHLK